MNEVIRMRPFERMKGDYNLKYLESIQETVYLSAGNAPQYRRIMRIFFIEYEKMHFQLYKEDVLELLKEYPEFSDYNMEQLKADLEALVGWKNLTPLQDPKRVYTIAEYKKSSTVILNSPPYLVTTFNPLNRLLCHS